jgi:hypothetical protein
MGHNLFAHGFGGNSIWLSGLVIGGYDAEKMRRLSWKTAALIVLIVLGVALARPGIALPPTLLGQPVSNAQPLASSELVMQGLGNGAVPLGGKWEFREGDDAAWASAALDDSGWERIGVDRGWGAEGHFAYTGYAWYRRHVEFVPVAGVKQDLALVVPYVDGPYEVYWNGKLIGHSGNLPPHPMWYFRPPPHSWGLGQEKSGVLAFRMWKAPLEFTDLGDDEGGFFGAPLAGSGSAVKDYLAAQDHEWLRNRQYYFFVNILYGLLALLAFIAWLRDRSQKLLFWVFLFALTQPIHVALFNAHLPLPYGFVVGFDRLVGSGAPDHISTWYMLLYLLGLDRQPQLRRWTRILAVVGVILGIMGWLVFSLDWSGSYGSLLQIADGAIAFPLILIKAYPLVLIAFALRKRISVANWLVAIATALVEMIGAVAVTALQGQRFTHWTVVYHIFRYHLFILNGNYFDPENIATGLLLLAIVYAVYRYSVEQSERQGAIEQEYKSAQELQRVLIPETLPSLKGYAVTSAYRPVQQVGGDFFQLIPIAGGSTLLVLGDVSGKGIKAAMTVSLLVGAARTLAAFLNDPAEVLVRLNERMHGRLEHGFVTCLVLRLDTDGGCVIASAGHPSPFLNHEEMSLAAALPLGLVGEARYETAAVTLGVGDRLTLYTDGLLEARNEAGELYGFKRLGELIAGEPDAREASEAAVAFGQDDDITVLTITRLAIGVESTTLLDAPALVSMTA